MPLSALPELAGLHGAPPPQKAQGLEHEGHAVGTGQGGCPASKHGAEGNEQPGIKGCQGSAGSKASGRCTGGSRAPGRSGGATPPRRAEFVVLFGAGGDLRLFLPAASHQGQEPGREENVKYPRKKLGVLCTLHVAAAPGEPGWWELLAPHPAAIPEEDPAARTEARPPSRCGGGKGGRSSRGALQFSSSCIWCFENCGDGFSFSTKPTRQHMPPFHKTPTMAAASSQPPAAGRIYQLLPGLGLAPVQQRPTALRVSR